MSDHSPLAADRAALSEYLDQERHKVVSEWVEAVRDDPQIPNADRLTLAALQDHFPEMLQELIASFRNPAAVTDGEIRETGHQHGKARWRNGYRFDEILRELARVRELLLARVRRFCDQQNFPLLRDESEETVRRFFDHIVATSARQFMREQEAEVLLRTRQLQNAYEQVQAATDQLREVAQSRLRLLRGVSHELRNALQAIGFGATALVEESDREIRTTIGSGLTGNAVRLQNLLDRLQQFSTILSGETRPHVESVNLGEFMATLAKTHRPAAESKGLEFRHTIHEGLATIQTDLEKLRHIADILLTNAIQYTERGSVALTALGDGPNRWTLRIEDSGPGFDASGVKHVFHEFHGSSSNRGVGLGLVIARHLAHLMDAEITFQSKPGEGSRFEVSLPMDLPAER